jgi:hypothetical protein
MCPNLKCRKILVVPETARGNRVKCIYCGSMLAVPKFAKRFRKPPSAEAAPADDVIVEEKKKK